MPFYDYACEQCGHLLEVKHGVHDSGPSACDRCGGPLRKLLSSVSIVFKGSGWAKKDARDARPAGTRKSSAGGDTSTAAGPAKSEQPSTEAGAADASGKAVEPSAAKQSGTPGSSAAAD